MSALTGAFFYLSCLDYIVAVCLGLFASILNVLLCLYW